MENLSKVFPLHTCLQCTAAITVNLQLFNQDIGSWQLGGGKALGHMNLCFPPLKYMPVEDDTGWGTQLIFISQTRPCLFLL